MSLREAARAVVETRKAEREATEVYVNAAEQARMHDFGPDRTKWAVAADYAEAQLHDAQHAYVTALDTLDRVLEGETE